MRRKILAVDDDQPCLNLLELYLRFGENATHNVIKATNGQEAWEYLQKHHSEIDVILLDRKMPVMTGDEFMRKHNHHKAIKDIPVIMQTGCAEREEILDGFKLGVYHYLTKPFVPPMLNSIVRSAISFYTRQVELSSEVEDMNTLFNYIDHSVYVIKDLKDVKPISISLARLFPNPPKVILGITELLINSIEHGNLGITYEEKTELNINCQWQQEVEKRMKFKENANKKVTISYAKKEDNIILNIVDEGKGFDYEKYLNFDPDRGTDNHGRGIAFANKECFDKLEYLGSGNAVNCIINIQ